MKLLAFSLRQIITFLFVFMVGLCAPLYAFKVPAFQGYVTDQTLLLSADERAVLESASQALEAKSGAQVATVIVNTLGNEPIESAAVKIFETWKIGQKGKDNGVLFLIAIQDQKMRVEVGYGLEGILNDGKVGALLDQKVIPYFREKRFSDGILSGHLSIIHSIDPELKVSPVSTRASGSVAAGGQAKEMGIVPTLILLAVIVMLIVSSSFRRAFFWFLMLFASGIFRGGGRGGGGGSGFGGFGGGGSGGGGSSRSW